MPTLPPIANTAVSHPGGQPFHTLAVQPPQAGARLDRFLADGLPALSRSRLKALIEQGGVTAQDGSTCDPSRKVRTGEIFRVAVPEPEQAEPLAQAIPLVVVYEDDHLIVIDKPPGLVVHPAAGNHDRTLVNALLHHCAGSLSGIGGVRRPGIVHRLDKDTSGLLVAAKTDRAHQGLAEQFAAHTLTRAYLAVCWGVPTPAQGEIAGNIGRSRGDRKKMGLLEHGGKPALTRYRVVRNLGGSAALVECRLATGRTHQIRVHLTAIGHPLIGDPTYGSRRAGVAARLRFPRQALHAFQLGFVHPASAERVHFESPLPNDINDLIYFLEEL